MKIGRTVAEVIEKHVTLEVECIDRMYMNVYVPTLQTPGGAAWFFRHVRGNPVPSSALMAPMTRGFVQAIEAFAQEEGVDLIAFKRGERKDDRTQQYLREWSGEEGVLYVGKIQEKARVMRTQSSTDAATGQRSTQLVAATAMPNAYYFYLYDDDFGPLFIKFCSYFPYNARLCINGHEYVKRQLDKRGIAYEALDNGILSCEDPETLRKICEEVTDSRIERLLRKWLRRLPHPFTAEDQSAGIRYDISILQAEFSLTQVFDRPVQGRVFFEEVIRENLDMGRSDQVQLIFNRRITKRTPSRFRTRVITDGVVPSLHIDYKKTRIKQYFKEGRALRTETIINDAYDFEVGRRLGNLEKLKKLGLQANRRLLCVQRLSHDCTLGLEAVEALQAPAIVDGQRSAALRFGDRRIQALMGALLAFSLLPGGFTNADLRARMAPLMGHSVEEWTSGRMTYDLRRLRLRGLIARLPRSRKYRITKEGMRTALCYHRIYHRVLQPTMSVALDADPSSDTRLEKVIRRFDGEVDRLWKAYPRAA